MGKGKREGQISDLQESDSNVAPSFAIQYQFFDSKTLLKGSMERRANSIQKGKRACGADRVVGKSTPTGPQFIADEVIGRALVIDGKPLSVYSITRSMGSECTIRNLGIAS